MPSFQLTDVVRIVGSFVHETRGASPSLDADTALLRDGLVDSFSLVQLTAKLERELALPLDAGALIPEDFETPSVLFERLQMIAEG